MMIRYDKAFGQGFMATFLIAIALAHFTTVDRGVVYACGAAEAAFVVLFILTRRWLLAISAVILTVISLA